MSTATTYTDQQQYLKFLKNKAISECTGLPGCGCQKCCPVDECGCCPAGLVAVYDDKSKQLACLTPNDAELYQKNTIVCQDGFVKVIVTATSTFLGCVSESNFVTIYTAVNA